MDWSKGFSASYYMAIVDKRTWNDISRLEITGGNISRYITGLRESADIDCPGYKPGEERWIRIWLDARQRGSSAHEALFTGLACSPAIKIDGTAREVPLECYSVLKPAEDYLLQRGWYAPSEANGAEMVRDMLRSTIPGPVVIEGTSPCLQQAIIAEDGESALTMADKILDAIGWRITINGMGVVTICEQADSPSAEFGNEFDVLETAVEIENDWFDCPNVFRAVSDDMTAVARDDSEASALSTVVRGREVWMEETNCDMNDGESIEEYALRRLKEEQARSTAISYARRFVPDIGPGDLIKLNYPAQNLQGVYKISEQTIELGYGAKMTEEVNA